MPDLSEATAARLLGFLVQAGAVTPADPSEDDAPAARQWTFHDLLFHTRSRLGRNNAPGGGLLAAPGSEAPPVVKPAMSDLAIPLARPDLFALESDLPFTTVLEERGAARRQGSEALTTAQLGEFLYRAARIKRVITDAGLSFRPYAGCAGLYAIEIYPLVSSCRALTRASTITTPTATACSAWRSPRRRPGVWPVSPERPRSSMASPRSCS